MSFQCTILEYSIGEQKVAIRCPFVLRLVMFLCLITLLARILLKCVSKQKLDLDQPIGDVELNMWAKRSPWFHLPNILSYQISTHQLSMNYTVSVMLQTLVMAMLLIF